MVRQKFAVTPALRVYCIYRLKQSQVCESICVCTRAVDGADGGRAEIFGGSAVQNEWGGLAATGQHSNIQPQRHSRE